MTASPWLDRRRFLLGAGATGVGGLVAIGGARALAGSGDDAGHASHDLGVVGTVDHERNGFDPMEVLTDFDGGAVSQDAAGRTVHEYVFEAQLKDIEVAPGVFFPAWTYNGRVPGPTIRVTEGARVILHLTNATPMPHTVHFHGFHSAAMDGVPGAGEVFPGESFTYDFVAGPFGTHLYHCHSLPLKDHIHRGLYGAFIVDPPMPRPPAHEMVMMLNGFDTDFDGNNEVYAVNTVAFAYAERPIRLAAGELQRAHVINITEFDALNSIHLHANFFHLYRGGTSLQPSEFIDTISMGQAERHMIEFTYPDPGRFMFHAHQTEFAELGWMSFFEVE